MSKNRKPGNAGAALFASAQIFLKGLQLAVSSAHFGVQDEKTYRDKIQKVVMIIASLKPRVIKLSNCFSKQNGSVCLLTVDRTYFRIPEPSPFWSGWYSHKFKGPGLRYEVGICIQTGYIVWTFGLFPCGKWPDIKIFQAKLKELLNFGEKVEADGGYEGDFSVSAPADCDNYETYNMKAAAQARHETVNK